MPYELHEVFEPPRANAPILRYMDFVKFVWLLDRASLYFTRVDRLGDRFEGSMSRANLSAREKMDERVVDRGRPELLRQWELVRRTLPQYHYVNCWTLSSYESVALWRLYVGDGNGVAIESTFRRLADAVHGERRPIFIGRVKYIDYDRDFIPEGNALYPFIRKRRSFEYEREVRALTSSLFGGVMPEHHEPGESVLIPPSPDGLVVPVDLERLILRVRVSPVSPPWFTELVHDVIKRYDQRFAVAQSDIEGDPVY